MLKSYRVTFIERVEAESPLDAAIKIFNLTKQESFLLTGEYLRRLNYSVLVKGDRIEIKCDENGYFESRNLKKKGE